VNQKLGPISPVAISEEKEEIKLKEYKVTPMIKKLIEELAKKFDDWKAEIVSKQQFEAEKRKAEQDKRKDVKREQFTRGDWVLVSIAHKRKNKKIQQWTGPYQIVKSESPKVYTVYNPIRQKRVRVHVRRIKFYAHEWLLKEEDIKEFQERQHEYFSIESILKIRNKDGSEEVKIKYRNMDQTEWLPLEEVIELAPKKLKRFVDESL
jgi:hypothetical protein